MSGPIDAPIVKIDISLFEDVPISFCSENGVWPVGRNGNRPILLVKEGHQDKFLPQKIKSITRSWPILKIVSVEEIEGALKDAAGASQVLQDSANAFRSDIDAQAADNGKLVDLNEKGNGPTARLLNAIVKDALQRKASDIHIEGYEYGVVIKFRVDGVLIGATEPIDGSHFASLVARIKVISDLDIAEKKVPQDGRFRAKIGERSIDFRVSTLPSIYGEDVVIRVLDKSGLAGEKGRLGLKDLNIQQDVSNRIMRAIQEPHGMILVTGPTGSGKTTTLYAAISELNANEEKIITIEDPIEYQLPGVVQIPVNEKKGLTFAKGLRSMLRHDPDKIMVGEIRDPETAEIAVQAALTGHLVFSTLHANGVLDVVGRLRHMGLSPYDLVASLNCIMAQRLLRRLCDHCKKRITYTRADLAEYGVEIDEEFIEAYSANGCVSCNFTGYSGRLVVVEFLNLSERMKDLLVEEGSLSRIKNQAEKEGYRSLRCLAVEQFSLGNTSLKEINRVTFSE